MLRGIGVEGWEGRRRRAWLQAAALLAATCMGAPAMAAAEFVAGPGGAPMSVAEAVRRAPDGATIELLPGEYAEVVVIENRKLTLRSGAGKVVVKGSDKPGPAPALWLVRGGDVRIADIEFRGARSLEGSGSGVRLEGGGKLTLQRCQFFDNEHGLSTDNDEKSSIEIDSSIFGLAPHVVGGLYHLLNVGRIGKLSITGSRFQQGFEGHMIRSRARENVIAYNFVHDGLRGGASYEIEIAAGGKALIIGNVIAQGSESQNPVLVAYGTESKVWDDNVLLVAHNTFINYGWTPALFLRVFGSRLPEGAQVHAVNNLLVGPGVFWFGINGEFAGNRQAWLGMLRDPDTYAFELEPGSMWRGSGIDPRQVAGQDLSPKSEFQWPLGTVPIAPGRTQWSPGAYQR